MASSPRPSSVVIVSLPTCLLLALLLTMTTTASSQIVHITFVNYVAQPLKVSNASPVPESAGSITVSPGGTGVLALDAADPNAVLLFNVGPDTYVLVSDNDLDRVFRDTRAGAAGRLTMTVSGPPCKGGQAGLQTLTAVMEDAVAKCADVDL